jgi:DNA-binding NarL/FixJ family response regulator
MQIRLLVAFHDTQAAHALCARIPPRGEVSILPEFADVAGVVRHSQSTRPDVLLLGHRSGDDKATWEVLRQLKQLLPPPPVLLACDAYTGPMIASFIEHGASGCLLASSDPGFCAKAVEAVHRGEPWFGRVALLQALRSHLPPVDGPADAAPAEQAPLTAREREVLKLIGNAMSNKEIARQLKISDKTVKTHLHHIYVKLNTSGRLRVFLSSGTPGHHGQVDAPNRLL